MPRAGTLHNPPYAGEKQREKMKVSCAYIMCVFFCVSSLGCKSTHEELNVKDPTGTRIAKCTDGSFSRNCSTTIDSQLPTGAIGGYGYGGAAVVAAPFPMVPYQGITPGMGAMLPYSGGGVTVVQPPSSMTVGAPAASNEPSVDNRKLQAIAAAVRAQSVEICKLKKGKNCDAQ